MKVRSVNGQDIIVKKGITTSLGVTKCNDGFNFAVAVEPGVPCQLLLYPFGCKEAILEVSFEVEDQIGNIYTVLVQNLDELKYEYIYLINQKLYLDPYARMITGKEEWGVMVDKSKFRCAFDFEEFDWEEDKPLEIPYHQTIMYSLHVRGFTMHPSSKVKNKGTFEGIIEKIPYLKELGVNQIELMPAYEFDEIIPIHESYMEYAKFEKEKQYAINYWGYTKANYFAPKASYTSGKDSTKAFKHLVKELHKNQIEVIMEFYFEEGMNQNLILDCINYWVEEYHIDGVHINNNVSPVTILASMPRLSRIKIMTEGFELNRIYKEGFEPKFKNLAEYNDGFLVDARRFLKGEEGMLNHIAYRLRRNPMQCSVINYITSHNGFTLMDLVSYDVKHNEANGENNRDGTDYNYSWNCGVEGPTRKKAILDLRRKQMKNALVLFLLSQGVPKINSGDEFGNTQNGNNNPYCQDNGISWINWNKQKKEKEILDFIKELIEFRKRHPILHNPSELKIMDTLSCGYPDLSYHGKRAWHPEFDTSHRQIGIMYCGKYAIDEHGKEDDFIFVAYNMHWKEHEFALPNLPNKKKWEVVIDTSQSNDTTKMQKIDKKLTVNERSIVILIGK